MIKSYMLSGTDKHGCCKQRRMRSVNKPNTNAWLAEVAELEDWDFRFTHYWNECDGTGCRRIKDKRPERVW